MTEAPAFRWTDELVARLEQLAHDGLSAAQIAERLGAPSRNAILGKAYRLDIALGRAAEAEPRPEPVKPKPAKGLEPSKRRPTARPKPALDPIAPVLPAELLVPPRAFCEPVADPTGLVDLLDLEVTSCRWPFGDPGRSGFGFCGKFRSFGATYCAEHAAIAYTSREAQRLVERSR